jgi:thiamine pyrophosphokinase
VGEIEMKALILVNGELFKPDFLMDRVSREKFDLVLGADGGARHARTLHINIDAVIGDMDSLPESGQEGFGDVSKISYPPMKNETDLELALSHLVKQGADMIVLVGMMGGRMDMVISNVQLLTHADLVSCRVEIWHGDQTAWVIRPPGGEVSGLPGDTVSLIPLSGDASGITTRGLKYPLHDERLVFGEARGISNVMERSPVRIEVVKGQLLVVHTPGGA